MTDALHDGIRDVQDIGRVEFLLSGEEDGTTTGVFVESCLGRAILSVRIDDHMRWALVPRMVGDRLEPYLGALCRSADDVLANDPAALGRALSSRAGLELGALREWVPALREERGRIKGVDDAQTWSRGRFDAVIEMLEAREREVWSFGSDVREWIGSDHASAGRPERRFDPVSESDLVSAILSGSDSSVTITLPLRCVPVHLLGLPAREHDPRKVEAVVTGNTLGPSFDAIWLGEAARTPVAWTRDLVSRGLVDDDTVVVAELRPPSAAWLLDVVGRLADEGVDPVVVGCAGTSARVGRASTLLSELERERVATPAP